MASLNFFVNPIAGAGAATTTIQRRRVVYTTATAAKSSGGGSGEEKSLLDFILGGLQKQDQLLETDPILAKVEGKTVGTTGRKGTVSAVVPPKKSSNGGGGFAGLGGLFAKK